MYAFDSDFIFGILFFIGIFAVFIHIGWIARKLWLGSVRSSDGVQIGDTALVIGKFAIDKSNGDLTGRVHIAGRDWDAVLGAEQISLPDLGESVTVKAVDHNLCRVLVK